MELIPVVLFIIVTVTLAWLAALPKRQDVRTFFCLLVVGFVSIVVGSVAYTLGGYFLSFRAHQGNKELKEFLSDIQSDLRSNQTEVARNKIEFILSHWDETEFIEENSEWGTWIGDRINESNLIKHEIEPAQIDNDEATPNRD